jgi:glycerol-3-phosphate acyltransferase PlsY
MIDSLGILSLLVAYLIGSIPFGILLARVFGMQDPRNFGSGNIGATNMLRSGRKDIALLTLLLDGLKGVLAVILTQQSHADFIPFAMILVVLGHVYSPWLNFKGGKGVATGFGVLFAISPMAGFMTAGLWLLTFYALRISSLAALIAMIFAPLIIWLHSDMVYATACILITALIFHTHRQNIMRLMDGSEPKFNAKPAPEKDAAQTNKIADKNNADKALKASTTTKDEGDADV